VIQQVFSKTSGVFIDKKTRQVFAYAPIFPASKEETAWIFIQETSFHEGGFKTVLFLKRLIIIITVISLIVGTYMSYFLAGWLARIYARESG